MVHPTLLRSASSYKSSTALRRPVFDVKNILARQHEMRESIRRRGDPSLDKLEFLVHNRHTEIQVQNNRNKMVAERKRLGQRLGQLLKAPADPHTQPERDHLHRQLAEYKAAIGSLEAQLASLSEQVHDAADALPNWLSASVPEDPAAPQVHSVINGKSAQQIEAALPPSQHHHRAIGLKLKLMEFDRAAQIAGSSWYYLLNDGALLEQALVQYALARARKAGYKMVIPPSIVKTEVVHASGFKPRDKNDEKQVYTLEGEPLALAGTAEIPLGALHSSSTISVPAKYVGVSRAYRAEAGARGKDTAGLYRVHEFTKVELYHFTEAARSDAELEELRDFQTALIADLGLKAKMLNMPTTDLGAPALKKYDCEAWMPGRGSWGELTSCSNCGDYQSRRLGIKHKTSGKLEYVHTLNGTAMAVPRVIVAILEQFYDPATESVLIPEVLRPYMDGKERIEHDAQCK